MLKYVVLWNRLGLHNANPKPSRFFLIKGGEKHVQLSGDDYFGNHQSTDRHKLGGHYRESCNSAQKQIGAEVTKTPSNSRVNQKN